MNQEKSTSKRSSVTLWTYTNSAHVTTFFYIRLVSYIQLLLLPRPPDAPMYMHALAVLERFSACAFHVGSLLLIVDYYKKRKELHEFTIVVALRGVIGTLAALQFTVAKYY